jgi:PAS domain S-box-containing protein
MSATPAAEKNFSTSNFLRWHNPPMPLRYAAAVLSVAAAVSGARWLEVHFETAPVSLFLCAVMLSAWFGGVGPGALAAALCILAFIYYFLAPLHSFAVETKEIPRVAIFVLSTIFVGALSAAQRRAAESLRKSRTQWRTVFEHNPHMYFMVDEDGIIVSVNPFGAEQLGYEAGELAGRSVLDLVCEPDREPVRRNIGLCFEQPGTSRTWEIRKLRKDGTTLWVRETANAMPKADDRSIVLVVCEDVTERRLAEEALREREGRIQRLVESNIIGVFFWSTRGGISDANDAFLRILGYSREELRSGAIRWADLTPPEYRAADLRALEELRRSGTCQPYEKQFVRKDGGRIAVLAGGATFEGASDQGVAFVLDLTERKQAEAERGGRQAAEMANQAKSEFLARMSHELRTPLTGILGYADILRGDRTLTERQLRGVGVIHQSGEHLLMLINDILDFARIEAGKLELSVAEISLARYVPAIADIIRVRAEEKQLAFSCELAPGLPEGVVADGRRLRQVLLNLLANAVKFTDRGEVSLRVSFSPPGRLRFEVRDTGVGISEDRWETIFQPFEQAGDLQHRVGGTGLGLAISRQLVRLMGSDIEIESRPGDGSTFRFELTVPVVQPSTATAGSDELITGYLGPRRKILVVDDVAANRLVLRDMLGPLGFEMADAVNGRDGLEKAQSLSPDLIVMDSVMPETDGLEATRRLREMPGVGEVAVIAISANASGTNEATALAAGADAFLSKPIELSALLAQIGELLQLQWTCEARASVPAPSNHAPEPLVAPPAQNLEVLHRLALLGNMGDIAREAARLCELDGRYRAFADAVQSLATRYQSRAILRLVEQHMDAARAP